MTDETFDTQHSFAILLFSFSTKQKSRSLISGTLSREHRNYVMVIFINKNNIEFKQLTSKDVQTFAQNHVQLETSKIYFRWM